MSCMESPVPPHQWSHAAPSSIESLFIILLCLSMSSLPTHSSTLKTEPSCYTRPCLTCPQCIVLISLAVLVLVLMSCPVTTPGSEGNWSPYCCCRVFEIFIKLVKFGFDVLINFIKFILCILSNTKLLIEAIARCGSNSCISKQTFGVGPGSTRTKAVPSPPGAEPPSSAVEPATPDSPAPSPVVKPLQPDQTATDTQQLKTEALSPAPAAFASPPQVQQLEGAPIAESLTQDRKQSIQFSKAPAAVSSEIEKQGPASATPPSPPKAKGLFSDDIVITHPTAVSSSTTLKTRNYSTAINIPPPIGKTAEIRNQGPASSVSISSPKTEALFLDGDLTTQPETFSSPATLEISANLTAPSSVGTTPAIDTQEPASAVPTSNTPKTVALSPDDAVTTISPSVGITSEIGNRDTAVKVPTLSPDTEALSPDGEVTIDTAPVSPPATLRTSAGSKKSAARRKSTVSRTSGRITAGLTKTVGLRTSAVLTKSADSRTTAGLKKSSPSTVLEKETLTITRNNTDKEAGLLRSVELEPGESMQLTEKIEAKSNMNLKSTRISDKVTVGPSKPNQMFLRCPRSNKVNCDKKCPALQKKCIKDPSKKSKEHDCKPNYR